MVRTIGIEEELLLVDPDTRQVVAGARRVLKHFREHGPGGAGTPGALDQELYLHQLEVRTEPATTLDDALAQVRAVRRTAGEAAEAVGLSAVACGIAPGHLQQLAVTRDDRYQDMVDTYGELAREAGTCGMHVHVAIESDEEGVAVIDRIAGWLPTLVAISANSPFHEDRDTGYASWRALVWTRWPSAGPTERFGSVESYYAVRDFLMTSGAARDPGMYYLDARLSRDHPTVEVRVADVCTDPEDTVLVTALVRALVTTAARAWRAGDGPAPWRAEELRACHWRAAKHGVGESLVHPAVREVRPAREVLEALVDHVRPALEEADDLAWVVSSIDRVLTHSGARAQRAAFERTGDVHGVVDDLVQRTRASWSDERSGGPSAVRR